MFAEQLSRVVGFLPSEAAAYQVGPDDFVAIQQRLLAWANHIRKKSTRPGFTAG